MAALVAALGGRTVLAPGIVELAFEMRVPARLDFKAGQFVSIAVDEPVPPDGVALPRRSYSIASQTTEGERLRFIIRVMPEGAASSYLMTLPLGAEIRLTGPHGFFVLDAAHAGDVVLGATGTGIAAVMPMLGALAARAGARLSLHLTAPSAAWTGARGRITTAILDALPTLATPTFYLVGNGSMITELKRELVERGVNRKAQIRTEAFFD